MRLEWDGERPYLAGVDRGVLYPVGVPGIAWSGLRSVTESSDDGEVEHNYYDGQRYGRRIVLDSFAAKVLAFSYPGELDVDGVEFGFSYRSHVSGTSYFLHLVYNAIFVADEVDYSTEDSEPSAEDFSFGVSTRPFLVDGWAPTAHVMIDQEKARPEALAAVEDLLYGTDDNHPTLPSLAEVFEIFEENSIVRIIDNGDGTWTATGPDEFVHLLDSSSFEIDYETVVMVSADTYAVRSK